MLLCAPILSHFIRVLCLVLQASVKKAVYQKKQCLEDSDTDRSVDQKKQGPKLKSPVDVTGGAPNVAGLWGKGSTRPKSPERRTLRKRAGRPCFPEKRIPRKRADSPCGPEKVRAPLPRGALWKTRPLEHKGVDTTRVVHLVHFSFGNRARALTA